MNPCTMSMRKIWFLIAGLMIVTSLGSSAEAAQVETPPKVEESTKDADMAAVHEAASESDQWAATHKTEGKSGGAGQRENSKENVSSASQVTDSSAHPSSPPRPLAPSPALTPKPAAPRSGLNEMKGKFQSKSYDPKTIRLIVDGGYNVEFTYDAKTTMVNGGSAISIDDLEYNDEVIVRYSGKELYAIEMDRLSKAPRPQ